MNGSRETFIPDPKLTEEFRRYCTEECGIDLLGIADVNRINENARPGRRACDLYPAARAVLVIGVGLLDPFTRGWVRSGNSGPFYSLALLELERRCWLIRRFLRQKGYQCYGGDAYGGGLFSCGSRFSNIAESCGMGYIGRSNALVTEKYGPRINLVCMGTNAPLEPADVHPELQCGSCRACQNACISGAIMGDGYFHQRQCECMINSSPNKRYYSDHVDQDCDRCLAVCPKGDYHWRKNR